MAHFLLIRILRTWASFVFRLVPLRPNSTLSGGIRSIVIMQTLLAGVIPKKGGARWPLSVLNKTTRTRSVALPAGFVPVSFTCHNHPRSIDVVLIRTSTWLVILSPLSNMPFVWASLILLHSLLFLFNWRLNWSDSVRVNFLPVSNPTIGET